MEDEEMQVKLTGGLSMPTPQTMNNTIVIPNNGMSRVNPKELTPEKYEYYCRLYLIENIYSIIPSMSSLTYGCVAKLINCIDPILFEGLNVETNKLLLLNEIYSLFMSASNEEISREFLYEQVTHISKYDPALYN